MLQEAAQKPRNPNHPPPGSTIKVDPIRTVQAISRVKSLLESNPRNYCLFVLGMFLEPDGNADQKRNRTYRPDQH